MRIRSVSLLATTFAALLGCPLDNLQTNPSDDQATSNAGSAGATGSAFENGTGHDDAVDSKDDVSWVDSADMKQGTGALRVLMTDAPIDADNVFVTFCGIYVEPRQSGGSVGAGDEGSARPDPGVDGGQARPSEERDTAGAGGSSGDGRAEDPEVEAERREAEAKMAAAGDSDDIDPAGESDEAESDDVGAADDTDTTDQADSDAADRSDDDAEARDGDGSDSGDVIPAEQRDDERPRDDAEGAPRDGRDVASPDTGSDSYGGVPRGWFVVSDQCQTVDLLTLRDGVTEAVGLATLPAGDYGRIGVALTEATIVKDGMRQRLALPAAEDGGFKVVGGFTLPAGEATTVTLDFDAGASVALGEAGLMLRPVIRIADVTVHGDEVDGDDGGGDDASNGGEQDPRGTGGSASRPAQTPEAGRGGRAGDAPPPPPPPPPGADPRKPAEGDDRHEPAPPPGDGGSGSGMGAGGADDGQGSGGSGGAGG